jgi:tetratricopeptide (TPR) repeat protein
MPNWIERGIAAEKAGLYEDALRIYESAIVQDSSEYAYASAADALIKLWRFAAARSLLNGGLREYPQSPVLRLKVATVDRMQGQFRKAEENLRKAEKLQPGMHEITLELANVFLAQGASSRAIETLDGLREQTLEALILRARALAAQDRRTEAKRLLGSLQPNADWPPEAILGMALALEAAGAITEAKNLLVDTRRKNLGDAQLTYELVGMLLRLGDPASASGLILPGDWYHLGWSQVQRGEYREAIETLKPAMETENAHAISLFAHAAHLVGHLREELDAYILLYKIRGYDRPVFRAILNTSRTLRDWKTFWTAVFAPGRLVPRC